MALLPDALQEDFSAVMIEHKIPREILQLVKAADTLSAYIKCQAEISAGNAEFSKAAADLAVRVRKYNLPEVDYFLDVFAHSYKLTLDELLCSSESRQALSQHEEILMGPCD